MRFALRCKPCTEHVDDEHAFVARGDFLYLAQRRLAEHIELIHDITIGATGELMLNVAPNPEDS